MKKALIGLGMLALVVTGGQVLGESDGTPSKPADDPRMDFLRDLAGTWVGDPHHEGEAPMRFEFRVTAGGHAVEEREMAGTPMEMLTVYHMNGDDLVATHYCMMGNQPRVVAAKRIENDSLRFDCAGTPGNETSHEAEHIHGWTLHLDGDTLHYQAALVANGEATEAPSFALKRESGSLR